MSLLSKEYKQKWIEKFLSLLVSGKMIFFFSVFISCIVLLYIGLIPPNIFSAIMISNITTIGVMRGAVEIAEVRGNGKVKKVSK